VVTERVFIMALVAFAALLFEKRVLSVRSVVAAEFIVLVLRPEALLEPGFQMSFAATLALVTVFSVWQAREMKFGPRWIQPVWILCLSSMVTGLATGPIAAAHFNIAAQYGLVDNLVYVPLMGVVIMPTGVVALLLMPFELDGVALSVMGLGLDWILTVADWVSHLEKAVIFVKAPSPVFLPLTAFSGLFLVLWIGSFCAVGVLGIVVASVFLGVTNRPVMLISDIGALIGVLTAKDRVLSKPKGAGFVARNWLQNDGDKRHQAVAAERWVDLDEALTNQVISPNIGRLDWAHVVSKKTIPAIVAVP